MGDHRTPTRTMKQFGCEFTVSDESGKSYWDSIESGDWEPGTYRTFLAFIRGTDTYIDFGAFLGATLLFAQNLCARSYAVEADPINYKQLLENIKLNPVLARRIVASHSCLAHSSGTVEMYSPSASVSTKTSAMESRGSTMQRRWEVEACSINDFLQKNKIQAVHFVKIDIEGAEYSLTNAIANLLDTQSDITVFLALHPHIVARSGKALLPKILKSPIVFLKRFCRTLSVVNAIRKAPNTYLPSGRKTTPFHILRFRNLRGPLEIIATSRTWDETASS